MTCGGCRPCALTQPGTQAAFDDYRGAVEALMIRRSELEARIAEQLPQSPWAQTAKRLMCRRGIDTLSASGCAPRLATPTGSVTPSS